MKINETQFCLHCGVLTDAGYCPICGSWNSMRQLKDYIAGDSKIPDRLYRMRFKDIQHYPHISNFNVCIYCHNVLLPGVRCGCMDGSAENDY